MDFVLVHLGYVVHFKVLHIQNNYREEFSLLTASLFNYHFYDNTFKKVNIDVTELRFEIPGKFQLIQVSKADCEVTGVLQPCILLGQLSKPAHFTELLLVQLTGLKKLVQIFHVCNNFSEEQCCFSTDFRFYICHGPMVAVIDSSKKKIFCYKKVENQATELIGSIEATNGTVFDFRSYVKSNTLECRFTSQQLNVQHHKLKANQNLKWMLVILTLNFTQMHVSIDYEDISMLPNVYCLSATALITSGKSSQCTAQ